MQKSDSTSMRFTVCKRSTQTVSDRWIAFPFASTYLLFSSASGDSYSMTSLVHREDLTVRLIKVFKYSKS